MRGLALGVVFVAGCGRIGFDGAVDGATGEGGPGSTPAVPLTLPAGGLITSVAIAPDGAWYAVSAAAGVFRSDDQQRWVPCGSTLLPQEVSVGGDGALYLVNANVIARSTDRCATFSVLGQPGGFVASVGHRGSEVYAAGTAGIERWTGAAWTPIATPFAGDTVWTFMGLPGGVSVIGSAFGGLAVSPDTTTWTRVTAGLVTQSVREIAVTPSRMYAITGADLTSAGGISCSDGSGAVWTVCANLGGADLAVDPLSPLHVIAAPYDNLVETRDGFASIDVDIRVAVGLDAASVQDLAFAPDGGLLLASARGVAYAPPASTLAFTPRNEGLAAWVIHDIVQVGADLYLAADAGVLHATAGDGAFTTSTTGVPFSTRASALAVAPDGEVIAVGRSVWASSDRGSTWRVLNPIGVEDLYQVDAVAFQGTRLIIASRYRVGVADPPYTSWAYTTLADSPDLLDLYADADGAWVATSTGVFVSRDGGASFMPTPVTTYTQAFATLPGGALVALTRDGVEISDPAREAWAPASVPWAAGSVTAIATAGETLVVAGAGGAFVTRDRGGTWQEVPDTSELPTQAVHIDPGDGSLVLGTSGRGLIRVTLP